MKQDGKSEGSRAQQREQTRTAILDATELIMREEGYAAVSSRRIAEKAGLKSQLVHYHYGSMDDLFLALFRRAEDTFFASMVEVLASSDPLNKLWDLVVDTDERTLVLEFTAIATHRKSFREELVRSAGRARMMENSILKKAFGDRTHVDLRVTPNILAFLLLSISRAVTMERGIGITDGHKEVYGFIEELIGTWKA
jgi:AcrR family transcriptional regulator